MHAAAHPHACHNTQHNRQCAQGYAFCEYYDRHSAESAVRNLNGADYQGRALRVDFAEETTVHTGDRRGKEERRGGGGGGTCARAWASRGHAPPCSAH